MINKRILTAYSVIVAFLILPPVTQSQVAVPATPEAAAEWARTLSPNGRRQALNGIVAAWAEIDPVAAAKWAKNLTGDEMWVVSSIARAWVEKDPLAASAWVLEMPVGPQRVQSLESIGQAWGAKSRSDALVWAEKIQPDLDRQAAVGGVIQSWAMQDSAAALKYAEGQTDMKSKEQLLGKVLYGWCFRDRPAAEKWVKELPEGDLKKAMEESLGRAPVVRRRVASSSAKSGVEKVKVGQEAPLFEVKTVDGKEVKLADFKGKYVLLDFWATWCGPCVGETPNLKAVFEKYGKREDFAMIGLSLDKEAEKPKAYAKQNGCDWVDGFLGDWGKDEVTKKYGVSGIPSIWLIGPDGKVVASRLRGNGIMEAVSSALDQKK